MSKKQTNDGLIANNRRAKFDYEITDTYEAGVMLVGSEVKSLRLSSVKLDDAHVQATSEDELEIVNLHINEYNNANKLGGHKPKRARKLLLHRREINKIISGLAKNGYTAIPLKMYFNEKGIVKLLIGLGKGQRTVDKRQNIKDREWKIEKQRAFKDYNK
ncbi:MAG: SsrA-binding protein SmpB [Alphaproteobacteria bacterium]